MSAYAIGDIQGCFEAFMRLLHKLKFNPHKDTLWIAGDLINRGPDSLRTLQWCHAHRDNLKIVLGNHDMHALALWHHNKKYAKTKDTLTALLSTPSARKLLHWMQTLPLLQHDHKKNIIMTHAGIPPQWNLSTLQKMANLAWACYQDHYFFKKIYGNYPNKWSETLPYLHKIRYTINALTRMRYVKKTTELDLTKKNTPLAPQRGTQPWFLHTHTLPKKTTVLFGHWSTLRLYPAQNIPPQFIPLDHGCVWGGKLSAINLQHPRKRQYLSISCQTNCTPDHK